MLLVCLSGLVESDALPLLSSALAAAVLPAEATQVPQGEASEELV